MTQELLIQELKKIEGISSDAWGYFYIRKYNVRVEYNVHNHELTLTKYRIGLSGEYDSHEIYYNNLELETILDLFRKLK